MEKAEVMGYLGEEHLGEQRNSMAALRELSRVLTSFVQLPWVAQGSRICLQCRKMWDMHSAEIDALLEKIAY